MSTGPRSFNESELNDYGRAPAFAALWDAFPVSTVSPGITWVKFGLEDSSTRGVAAGAIEQAIVTHRRPEAPKRSVGFTIAEDEPRPESGEAKA